MWRLISLALLTRLLLHLQIDLQKNGCVLCGEEEESTSHMFRKCHFTHVLSFKSGWALKLHKGIRGMEDKWIYRILNPQPHGELSKDQMVMLYFILVYMVWTVKNKNLV